MRKDSALRASVPRTVSYLFPLLLSSAIAGAESSVLFGRVVTEDGEPLSGAEIRISGSQGSINSITDDEGRYRIERPMMKARMQLIVPEMGVEELYPLHEIPRGEQERNFTVAPRMRVEGSITIRRSYGWMPMGERAEDLLLTFAQQRTKPTLGEDGGYVAHLPAGEVTAWTRIGPTVEPGTRPFAPFATFTVEKDVPDQRHDLRISYVSSRFLLRFPEDADFQPGMVSLNPASVDMGKALVEFRADKQNVSSGGVFMDLVEGRYIATFTSDDKLWTARQEVDLRYNERNYILLMPRLAPRGERIAQFGSATKSLAADITSHVIPGGSLSLIVTREASDPDYLRRYEGARILAGDRSVVAEDLHSTVMGNHEIDNTFRFEIPEAIPPGPYTFHLIHPPVGTMALTQRFGVYLESDSR